MKILRIAMAQMNPTVGDLNGNVRRILSWIREAKKAKADLVAFPELAITGCHPEDLLLKPWFVSENRRALKEASGHRGLRGARCEAQFKVIEQRSRWSGAL
jgi:NAD+ synthase (glutamine-hydrolysing)